jgi:acyl-CoA dehydrogenase
MDFAIPEHTAMLIEAVGRFVDAELVPHEDLVEQRDEVPADLARHILERSRSHGFYAMNMPVEAGGGGLSALDMCLVEERIGRVSEALIRRAFGAVLGSLAQCTGDQRERYLIPAVRGDLVMAIAMTEPQAGSDAAGIRTRAVRDGGDFVLTGAKHFISDAGVAGAFLVSAVTDPDRGAKGITAFLVDRGTPGFTIGARQTMMGLRGVSHHELFFDAVRLPRTQILGEEGTGLFQVLSTLDRVRLAGVGARSVGLAGLILERCVEQAAERRQFGQAIGQFQMIQAKLADMAMDIFATRMMVLNTAWEFDQGLDVRTKVAMVKVQASEMLGRVTDHAIQIFGGSGFSKSLPFERWYRDARVNRILDGTSEIHRHVVARSLLRRHPLPL